MRLLFEIRPDGLSLEGARIFHRRASRAIVLRGEEILLLYTKAYNDFSFPGGGVDDGEDLIVGLKRELTEETGATGIEVAQNFGFVDEIRRHHKPQYDLTHMLSYFYVCNIDHTLGEQQLEHYEIANGMDVQWININKAIDHNRKVIATKEKSMGLSIERETLALEIVKNELITPT